MRRCMGSKREPARPSTPPSGWGERSEAWRSLIPHRVLVFNREMALGERFVPCCSMALVEVAWIASNESQLSRIR